MTSTAIAETETTTATTTTYASEAEPVTITVSVDFNNDVCVNHQFVRVLEGGSREITWELQKSPTDPRIIVFDNPPIRILSSPDQPQPLLVAGKQGLSSVTFTWHNDNPALSGTSFAYRVHGVVCHPDGTFTPVASDPIIRNDPPPAP